MDDLREQTSRCKEARSEEISALVVVVGKQRVESFVRVRLPARIMIKLWQVIQ